MEVLGNLLTGFEVVFQPTNLLYVFIGVLIGTVIGVLPGLGPTATIALLLPLTYTISPEAAIIMLAGIYYGSMYGGTITSVLLQLPGEAASVVTAIDGYQMARQGRAGPALGIAAIGSFIGGTVSVVGLTLFAPLMASVALRFGPPEFTALTVLGILLVTYLGTKSFAKSHHRRVRSSAGHRRPGPGGGNSALYVRGSRLDQWAEFHSHCYGSIRCGGDPVQP